jgi:KDO2-lipid IV(A) lauroyltransferase
MAKERNDLLDRITYVALRVVTMGLHSWGINASLVLARIMGSILFRFDKKHRDRALANLRRSFPEKTEAHLRDIALRSMQALCMLGVEVLFTPRLMHITTFTRYITFGPRFDDVLRLLLRRNQGLIMLTGHYGNWEVLGYTMATMGFGVSAVARPLDNPYISDYIFGVREASGQKMIYKKGATEEMLGMMERRGALGFTADQNAGAKGIFVDFFGRKASSYKSIGLLAMEYKVPIVIGYARRIGQGFRFVVACQDIIYPDDWKDVDDPLKYITQRYTRAIEDFVREEQGQYFWFHRRWKSRPKGELPGKYD